MSIGYHSTIQIIGALTTLSILCCICTTAGSVGSEVRKCDFDADGTRTGSEYNLDCGRINYADCPGGTTYDTEKAQCIGRRRKRKHKRQVAIVGMPCQENIDCQTNSGGTYCDSTKRCDCLPAYANINGYCWAKRNPGESCAYMEQCTSVTPNAHCAADGTCQCNNNQPPYQTIDGTFCILPGECPTNGANSKLRDPASGSPIKCNHITGFNVGADGCGLDDSDTGIAKEVYNCLCLRPLTSIDILLSCINDTENSYCCPVRAIACVQPRDEGSGNFASGTSATRWWYNSATDACEPFNYRGNGGNGNNFQTKALCDSYCRTVCPRGKPSENPATTGTVIRRCSATTDCPGQNHYCNTEGRGVYSLCCPTPDYICGEKGGLMGTDQLPGEGDNTYNSRAVTRFYYDGQRQCRPFTYRGLAGTFNNFHTEAECRSFCSSAVCGGFGEPLRDRSGTAIGCGTRGTGVCPDKYSCNTKGYCCPTRDFVCSQPQAIGGCSAFTDRWWFNPTIRSCEKFSYSGCQGNFNNFPTYRECAEYCAPSSAKPVCPQGEAAKDSGGASYIICSGMAIGTIHCPPDYYCHFDGSRHGCCPTRTKTCSVDERDAGVSCITPVSRWYYDSETRQCDVFTYNGCDGNSNNFPTKIDCQDYCGVGGCPEGGEPLQEQFTGQYRVCGTGGSECPSGFTCSIVTLGTTSRYNYCCPTRAFICALPQDQGHSCGTSTLSRYYFNIATKACESFTYNGCGGNRNNFATLEQCLNYCSSAGCPPGTVALQDAITKRVTVCDTNGPNTCSGGYTCIFSTTLQQGVCCGSTGPAGSCPPGQIAYMDSYTHSPLQCQPNVEGSCPNGIFCQYSFTLQNSFCCSSRAVQCPKGGDPYVDLSTNQARQCTPGLADVCPPGNSCQLTTVLVGDVPSATGYCCGVSNVCGKGYAPYFFNNQPVSCLASQVPSQCIAPFHCLINPNTQLSYCCVASGLLAPVCVAGKEAYTIEGAPTLCTEIGQTTACPAGYTCDLYAPTGSHYCCRPSGGFVSSGGCPAPYVLLQPITACSPGVIRSCPANYFCMHDAGNSRYVCCGTGAVAAAVIAVNLCAPNHGQAVINPATRQPQTCALGTSQTGCPIGATCAYSTAMRNYYCCTAGVITAVNQCPAGYTPALTLAGQLETCAIGLRTCPAGYDCIPTGLTIGLCCKRAGVAVIGNIYSCPVGSPYIYPGSQTPLICTRNGPPCPAGYQCRHSTKANAWYCCSNMSARRSTDYSSVWSQ